MEYKLWDPLEFYLTEGRDRYSQYAKESFEKHLEDSGVDERENQLLAEAYEFIDKECKKLKNGKNLRIFYGILATLVIMLGIGFLIAYEEGLAYPIIGCCFILAGGWWLFGKVIPDFKSLSEKLAEKIEEAERLLLPPRNQLERLDNFFATDESLMLTEKTIPELHFHSFCSRQHQSCLEALDFRHSSDCSVSVTNTLAGDFRGNPFLFTTVLQHTMRNHKYTGSKTIHWEEEQEREVHKERTYTDSNGKKQTEYYTVKETVMVPRSQTLTESVIAQVPCYSKVSSLGYGHPMAPDLYFSRYPKHIQNMSAESIRSKVIWKGRTLRKKSERAIRNGQEFLMMANEEFEVLFGATDRNNDHQFRLLFTPQAQNNMIALLKDSSLIGDEFSFKKHGKYNTISCDERILKESPTHYHDYSVQEARKNYLEHHQAYFRRLFGTFAPLLAIPGYQESFSMMPQGELVENGHFAECEHEAMANRLPLNKLVTVDTETAAILKTRLIGTDAEKDLVEVKAYGYTTRNRVETFNVRGKDGKDHDVDVHWVEYIPRVKTTTISIEPKREEEQSGGVCFHGLYVKIVR